MSDGTERARKLSGPFPRLVREGFAESYPGQESWNALRQQNELILNAAGEGIYGLDLLGRTTFANPAAAAMTGHSIEELLGKSMHDIVHHSHESGEHYGRYDCPIYAAFQDGLVRNVCDEVFWRKDGSSFPVEYTSTPIYNSGEIVGAVVVFRDISIRKRTEERLRTALEEVRTLKERLQEENRALRRRIESTKFPEILGSSEAIERVLRLLTRTASTDSTVLLLGETGTGKELFAKAIHEASARRNAPLIRLNCGAISDHLVESELFGHERGAFTGAERRRVGRFEQADTGTLFLDEVGELPLQTQVKLLRALQEREFERVGGNQTVKVNVRVVAATNRNLAELVQQGTFRQDLFYRLSVVPVGVPALRERREDIPVLVDHFLSQLEKRWGRRLGRLPPNALGPLLLYEWPGNVRELQNVMERAALENEGEPLSDLSRFFQPTYLTRCRSEPAQQDPPAPEFARARSLNGIERAHILSVLRQCHFKISGPGGAAAILDMHPNTLRSRMQKLGISRDDV